MSRSMPTTGKGNRLTETDANGNTTRYAYDEQIFTVDGNGNLKTKTDPDGYVTTYGYNGLDMVTSINYNDGKEVTSVSYTHLFVQSGNSLSGDRKSCAA